MQNNYVEELKNGKQIRIKYNKFIHDYVEDDSGWKEELWCYDSKLDLFKCYYPVSTYEEDFYTIHTEDSAKSFMDEAVRDKKYDEENVTNIMIEDCNIPNSLSVREAAIEKLKTMTDEEIKQRILLRDGDNLSKKYTAKYLRITMHDNDFWFSLTLVADMLYKIFNFEGRFPEEDELPLLKKYIQSLWFSLDNISDVMCWNKNSVSFKETAEKHFEPTLEFVDYLDIPEWDNDESVYIPMFEIGEIIRR